MHIQHRLLSILILPFTLAGTACHKLVSIPEPINTLTTVQVFSTDAQATSALAAVYSEMINGAGVAPVIDYFTIMPALSSDEMTYYNSGQLLLFNKNRLTYNDGGNLWAAAYNYIYGANAVIYGVASSTSALLHDSVRKELTGEAKFIRAFWYVYLTNLYGDVPLALTIDFSKTAGMARTPQDQVYQQIIQDLKDAQVSLPGDYSVGLGERTRPNKWAATALLARVYLYTGKNDAAAAQAGDVIAHSSLYALTSDPNATFLKNSTEAIWQLQQNTSAPLGTATALGMDIIPKPQHTGYASYCLSDQLLSAFEPGDLRRAAWTDSTSNSSQPPSGVGYYPFKYKTGKHNYSVGGVATEYFMMLRLAEQYLIRAEAEANGASGGNTAALADLNVIRARAGLAALSASLSSQQVIAAVARERQTELFAEWGHRWLDLKRTGQAHALLTQIPSKQPWLGDYQLAYPIPQTEIMNDPNLQQNAGY